MEYHILEDVKVIVFSKLIGNWVTEVSIVTVDDEKTPDEEVVHASMVLEI